MQAFSETGLPWDEKLFKAYTAFEKGPGLGPDDQNHPVRMAQLFNNVAASDAQLQALAFIAYIPEAAYGQLERRFGTETMDFAREISAHMRTGFAYIDEASPQVKAFAMADNIAWMEELDEKFYDIAAAVHAADEKGEKAKVEMPNIPSQRVLDNIAKFALKTSGQSELEGTFIDKIERFRESLPEKLEVLGISPMPAPEAKAFDQTGLLNDPVVKNAYAALMANPRLDADDVALATEAAQLLSASRSTQNPTAIANTLLDLGIPNRGQDDVKFLSNRVDWDVLELFAGYNVRAGYVPEGIKNAPIELRQEAMSWGVISLDRSLKKVGEMFTMMEEHPERFTESAIPMIKSSVLTQLGGQLRSSQGFLKEIGDTAQAPELKGLMETKIDAVASFIAEKTPKPVLMLPAPKKKPGKEFDLKPGRSFDL